MGRIRKQKEKWIIGPANGMTEVKKRSGKSSGSGSIFDDVIRTAQERHGKLLIPW